MDVIVSGRKLLVTDALRSYAEEKIGGAIEVLDVDPTSVEVVLRQEKNPANPRPAVCEVTVQVKGHLARVEETEEDMYAAIDVAAAKAVRQLRKYKNRIIDKRTRATEKIVDYMHEDARAETELDLDKLMNELTDDEVVRTKEIDFAPMTVDEALIEIDLIGHDFYVFTDRDSSKVCVLYRRNDGGYGLLKQAD